MPNSLITQTLGGPSHGVLGLIEISDKIARLSEAGYAFETKRRKLEHQFEVTNSDTRGVSHGGSGDPRIAGAVGNNRGESCRNRSRIPYVTGAGQRGVTGAGNLKAGLAPRYDQKTFPASEKRGRLRLVGSPDGRDGSIVIHQDTDIYDALLSSGDAVTGGEDPRRGDVKNVHRHEPFQGPKPRTWE